MSPMAREMTHQIVANSIKRGLVTASPHSDYDILVHFRCSDSPINRHPDYRKRLHRKLTRPYCFVVVSAFIRLGWFKRILDELQNGQPARIRVLSCLQHGSVDLGRQACAVYAEDFLQYLRSELTPRPKRVQLHCGTIAEDFADMVRAPFLVSSGSSMSAMAAFGRKPNTTVLPSLYLDGFYYPGIVHMSASSRLLHLPHAQVLDYLDTATVCKQLRLPVNASDMPTLEFLKEWFRT